MTKLQAIVAEIEALPAEEQQELVSMFAHLVPNKEDFFELTEVELAELDQRMLNADREPMFTPEEAFALLREKYVQGDVA
jgi:hypothetical protein